MGRFTGVLLGACLSLFIVATAQAQVALGVRGGYSNSDLSVTVDGQSAQDLNTRNGLHGGVDVSFGLSHMVALEAGASYAQKGATQTVGDVKATLAADYIDVPLVLALNIPTSGTVAPRIFFGPVGSFELSCKFKGGTEGSSDCTDAGFARKSYYVSVLFGGGVGFGLGPGNVVLDFGFQLGMTNISEVEGEDAKMNVFQVSAGYRFPLGGRDRM
jgi:hypothetical protein